MRVSPTTQQNMVSVWENRAFFQRSLSLAPDAENADDAFYKRYIMRPSFYKTKNDALNLAHSVASNEILHSPTKIKTYIQVSRGDHLRANYRAQVNALFRKQLVQQRRNKGQNCCLLIAPIFFCILLLIIQTVINTQFNKPDYKCGCECLLGYEDSSRPDLTCGPESPSGNACSYTDYLTCQKHNTTNCGIEYSKTTQSAFCAIPDPPRFPELLQVPRIDRRAVPYAPNIPLITVIGDGTSANAIDWADQLVPPLTSADYDRVYSVLVQVRNDIFDAELANDYFGVQLALLNGAATAGLPLATAVEPSSRGYIDNAWVSQSQDTKNLIYIIAEDCPAFEAQVNEWKNNSTFTVTVGGMQEQLLKNNYTVVTARVNGKVYEEKVVLAVGSAEFGCLEGIPRNVTTVAEMNRLLYCGFYDAACNGKRVTNEYSYGFDTSMTQSGPEGLRLLLAFNDTNLIGGGGNGQQELSRVGKAVNLVTNAFLRKYYDASFEVELQWFAEMPKQKSSLSLDFSSLIGPAFFLWVLELLMPVMLQNLVYEKERRLRIMMKMHGLDNRTYVTVTFFWWLIVYILYFFLLLIFGSIIGLKYFRLNNYGIQILTYLLHGTMQISWAFLLSCFFRSPKTAVVFGYIYVFISGLICNILLNPFFQKNDSWVFVLELIPGFSLYRCLWEFGQYGFLGAYRNTRGMMPKNLKDAANGTTSCWAIMILEFVVLMPLALYLEQVISDNTGVRRPWYFPLEWFGLKLNKGEEEARIQAAELERKMNAEEREKSSRGNADVAAERSKALDLGPANAEQFPIVCHGLKKIYPAFDIGQPPKLAVRDLSMAIERGECFGLLGPNGAGKTTSISMLIGFLEPTEGTAFVEGLDIRTEMSAIYSRMGVCPQHDILWETLTAREHLLFYGRLKNLDKATLQAAVNEALVGVNLMQVANKLVGQFSGGMKRRLSVAISFIGRPAVVYLDEPSTGLDPASRRALWDVVRANKKDKALILTTHSMQEAEVLCDRLGIFINGELFCLGAPKELSTRYGGYLVLTITSTEEHTAAVQAFVRRLAPAAQISYSLAGTQKFKIPLREEVPVSALFEALASQREFPVQDYALHHASLEDVFVDIARSSGAKMETRS